MPQLSGSNPALQTALEKLTRAEQKKLGKFDEKLKTQNDTMKIVKDFKGKVGAIKDAMTPFKKVEDFRDLLGISSDPTVLTAQVDKTLAKPASYEIEVMEMAKTSSIMTTGFPDKDRAEVGVGFLSFTTPDGEEKSVYINTSNNTLEGVAKAINEAKVGARAQVINDGTDAEEPWRLVVTSEKTGWKNDFQWAEFNMLDGDLDLDTDKSREASSALIKLNGQAMYADENTIKNLMPGVTVALKKAKPGDVINLEVKPDYEKIGEKAKNFVDKMNDVFKFINEQNNLGSKRDPTKPLGGDVVTQTIESRLRTVVMTTARELPEAKVQALRDMGIVFNRTGSLDFDQKKFQTQLENNFDEVASLFVGDEQMVGFASKVVDVADSVVRRGDGMMSVRETVLQSQITNLERQKEQAEARAQERMDRAKFKFSQAEAAVEKMKSMQNSFQGGSLIG